MTRGPVLEPEFADANPTSKGWGDSWRQRLRFAPLSLALTLADRLNRYVPARPARALPPWREGISVVIPERAAPEMLAEALTALAAALARVGEPWQVIVAVNGAPRSAYADVERRFPEVEFVWSDAALGFVAAIELGLALSRHDWTYLLNNDMLLDADALTELLPLRADGVFAIASQIFQRNAQGRREETGFVDWYVDRAGVQVHHAPIAETATEVVPHLCASGGAALFRTSVLREYIVGSRCYHPFYWEDVEWGLRAWRDGLAVLFAPRSRATHRHRATTARFHAAAEIDRIVARNRLLFDARHDASGDGGEALLRRICDQPYASQRELARVAVAAGVFRSRLAARRSPQPLPPPVLSRASGETTVVRAAGYCFRPLADLPRRTPRRRLLLVTPFAVFPPRHGGARRVAAMLDALKQDFDVILLADEAGLHDGRSLAGFDGLYAIHLVQRGSVEGGAAEGSLDARWQTHCHRRLVAALDRALDEYAPDLVQIEYAELAPLVRSKRPGQRWILDLHDACSPSDFSDAAAVTTFERELLPGYDAVTACSDEDRALVRHPNVVTVRNGNAMPSGAYQPSTGAELLFVGPFRYPPNLAGLLAFVRDAFPAIRAAHPTASLRVLGGDGAPNVARGHPVLSTPGILVEGHRDDVAMALEQCVLTVNPLTGIRGSAVKLVESLSAGRICVTTTDGARGFGASGLGGLVAAPDVAAMTQPIIELLADNDLRHAREAPDATLLAPHQWPQCLAPHRALCARLLG